MNTIGWVTNFLLLNSALTLLLRLTIIKSRKKYKIRYGHNNNLTLQKQLKAQENHLENLVLGTIIFFLLIINENNVSLLISFGTLFTLGRITRVIGILYAEKQTKKSKRSFKTTVKQYITICNPIGFLCTLLAYLIGTIALLL